MREIMIGLLSMIFYNINAQSFMPKWISYPEVDSTSQIWFRQTYITDLRPTLANINITTTGQIELMLTDIMYLQIHVCHTENTTTETSQSVYHLM